MLRRLIRLLRFWWVSRNETHAMYIMIPNGWNLGKLTLLQPDGTEVDWSMSGMRHQNGAACG